MSALLQTSYRLPPLLQQRQKRMTPAVMKVCAMGKPPHRICCTGLEQRLRCTVTASHQNGTPKLVLISSRRISYAGRFVLLSEINICISLDWNNSTDTQGKLSALIFYLQRTQICMMSQIHLLQRLFAT